MSFASKLIQWYSDNKRELPWRNTRDPYKIWLSEIILQQTRVAQGLAYYQQFVNHFPTVQALAAADQEEVLNLWQGLGYYSRARNLHFSANYIVNELNGEFPKTFQTLLNLKGVGVYTAAAIASFAYDEIVPVVDGNVYRVLGRHFKIDEYIDTPKGQKFYFELAKELISKKNPAEYNQAIMEFGALHCTPKQPQCDGCIFNNSCLANDAATPAQYPKKKGKVKVKPWYIYYFVFRDNDHLYIRKRTEETIWANLYDFPSIDNEKALPLSDVLNQNLWLKKSINDQSIQEIYRSKHILSHRKIHATFYQVDRLPNEIEKRPGIIRINEGNFSDFPVSKLIDNFWHHFRKEQAVGK